MRPSGRGLSCHHIQDLEKRLYNFGNLTQHHSQPRDNFKHLQEPFMKRTLEPPGGQTAWSITLKSLSLDLQVRAFQVSPLPTL